MTMSLTSRLALSPDLVAPAGVRSASGVWSRFWASYARWQARRAAPYIAGQLMQLRPDRLLELGYAPTEIADLMLAHRVPDHRIL